MDGYMDCQFVEKQTIAWRIYGFVDGNKNLTGEGDLTGKRLILLSEPQIWYNLTSHFSAGSEIELSYNFVNKFTESRFRALPTLAAKWNF